MSSVLYIDLGAGGRAVGRHSLGGTRETISRPQPRVLQPRESDHEDVDNREWGQLRRPSVQINVSETPRPSGTNLVDQVTGQGLTSGRWTGTGGRA